MRDISAEVSGALHGIDASEAAGRQNVANAEAIARQVEARTANAASKIADIDNTLDRAEDAASDLGSRLQQDLAATREVGVALARLFGQVEAIVSAIETEKQRGDAIEAAIQEGTARCERTKQRIAVDFARWSTTAEQVARETVAQEQTLRGIKELFGTIHAAEGALLESYALLREKGYELLEHSREQTGIHTLFVDADKRVARVLLKAELRAAELDQLVLRLELPDLATDDLEEFEQRLAEMAEKERPRVEKQPELEHRAPVRP